MASDLRGYTEQETLNKVLNTDNDSIQVDIVDATGVSITTSNESVYADDADWTDSTSKHTLVGGLYQSSPQTITDGDVGPFQVDADGALHISDGGNAITVDGTVSVSGLLADGHAVTIDNTDSNEVYVRGSGTAGSADAKVLTVQGIASGTALAVTESSPISGFATSANQSTIIGHVDGVETLLGTIDSDTDATKTATEASQAALEKMLYGNALVVTAVDGGSTQALGATYESLYVGVGGNVVVTMVGTGNFTFSNVASGQLLPIRITHVINTGTTATNMIALKA